jgi:hypothetical protein
MAEINNIFSDEPTIETKLYFTLRVFEFLYGKGNLHITYSAKFNPDTNAVDYQLRNPETGRVKDGIIRMQAHKQNPDQVLAMIHRLYGAQGLTRK